MVRLIAKYLKRYALFVVLSVLLIFVQVITSLMLPNLMSTIVDVGVAQANVPYIISRGGQMLCWAVLSSLSVVAGMAVTSRAAMSVGRDMRRDVFRRVMDFSLYEFDGFGTSSLITRTTNDVQQLERIVMMLLSMALIAPIMFVGSVVMVVSKSGHLAVVVLCAIPVMLLFVGLIMRKGLPLLRSLQSRIDALNRVTREGLVGIRVIRAYNKTPYEEARFAGANSDLAETLVKVGRLIGFLIPVIIIILNLVIVAVMLVGAPMVEAGGLMVGDLMAIVQYAGMVLVSVMMLSVIFAIAPRAAAAAERINAVLDTQPSIVDPEPTDKPNADAPANVAPAAFEHVSYTFPDADRPVLSDIDLALVPGQTTVLIGSTGSGKSTIINLIMRFFDATSGTVRFMGEDVRDLPQAQLRSRIAYAPQKTVLFSGTIAENIAYGAPGATEEDILRAARIAQADEFIQGLEGGYQAHVAQGGSNLSGGQRQRIAIARTVACDADLYIFDDSFSALDFKTDALIREALLKELDGKTVLIVAQRVSSAMEADRVIVLDEGRVVGDGTHRQLVRDCAVYREIAASQLSIEDLSREGIKVVFDADGYATDVAFDEELAEHPAEFEDDTVGGEMHV